MPEETPKPLISPDQVRAARALLGWNQSNLARAANVSRETIADFESGKRTPIGNNMVAIIGSLEIAGIAFVHENDIGAHGSGRGVRWFGRPEANFSADRIASLQRSQKLW